MNNLVEQLPKMLIGNELIENFTMLPDYNESICNLDAAIRLMTLSDLYDIYIPSTMSMEIYSKLYLAMLHSLQKKTTLDSVRQRNQTFRRISNGIIGGSDSFSIIGSSGIGKSSAIFSSLRLIGNNKILVNDKPFMKVIPILNIQCPFDCSTKSMLLSILKEVDIVIGTNYYEQASKVKTTTDYLISSVSQCCLNNVGLIVIDEIQNIVTHKNGINLVGCLTQLINSSGISIAMVGTPEVTDYFSSEMQLARRSLGLRYSPLDYNEYFINFCKIVFRYQYVKYRTEITDSIIEWLYEHSAGVISVVISLLHDAQEISIMSGREKLDLVSLNQAYTERMKMMHGYLKSTIIKNKGTTCNKKNKKIDPEKCNEIISTINIYDLAMMAKNKKIDAIGVLKQYISITEITI